MTDVAKNAKVYDGNGIRTHASEETGALNQRLRPLGHPASWLSFTCLFPQTFAHLFSNFSKDQSTTPAFATHL